MWGSQGRRRGSRDLPILRRRRGGRRRALSWLGGGVSVSLGLVWEIGLGGRSEGFDLGNRICGGEWLTFSDLIDCDRAKVYSLGVRAQCSTFVTEEVLADLGLACLVEINVIAVSTAT